MKSSKLIITLFVCLAATASVHAQTINVVSLGAHPDGSNMAATTLAFIRAFNYYPSGKIIIPAGVYTIDNSQGELYIPNFSGEIEAEGDAQLIFQSPAFGGLRFVGGTGARIRGLHGKYATRPVARTGDVFSFTSMTDLTVEDSIAENSPGMGFLFALCIRPHVSNITVDNTVADGLAFANSQNATLTNYTSTDTIDNGLGFYNYASLPDLNGATINNIHINRVLGAHGITVAGTSNVVISNFIVDQTGASAIWISQDTVWGTRASSNVVMQHGVVNDAGIFPQPNANNFGIEYTAVNNVTFSDISITAPQGRGVSGTAFNGAVRFHNVRVSNNASGDAWVLGQTAMLEMSDCLSENSPNGGFSFDGVQTVVARDLKVIDSSSQSSLHRAIWFQNGGTVTASGLMVIDDRPAAAGYVVGTADINTQQQGSIQGVLSSISNGSLVVNSYSPYVRVSNAH